MKGKDLLELMFDDGSSAPFALYIEASMCDRPNLMGSFEVSAWTRSGQVGQWTGHYRVAKKLPCLQPWKTPKSNSQTSTFNRR
ncbi:MAG: hypothetical protein IPJ18_05230 [Betaproteobacteria bacterium]|nr:hypothetical protein [Betaproteobacteria bacterium]